MKWSLLAIAPMVGFNLGFLIHQALTVGLNTEAMEVFTEVVLCLSPL